MFIRYFFILERFRKHINGVSAALLPLLSSIKVWFSGNKNKFEQKDSWTACHWMLLVTMYVLTLLQMPATCEMLWKASKAHANCRRNHAKQIFPNEIWHAVMTFFSTEAEEYNKTRKRIICLLILCIAVTHTVVLGRESIVQSLAQVQNAKSLPFKAFAVQLSVSVSWQWIGPWLYVETATNKTSRFSHSRNEIQRFGSFPDVWFRLPPWHQGVSLLYTLLVAICYKQTQHLPILIIGLIRRKDQYLG